MVSPEEEPADERKTSVRQHLVNEASLILDFLIFCCCVYISFVGVTDRYWLSPLSSSNSHSNATGQEASSYSGVEIDYVTVAGTILVVALASLALGRVTEWTTLPALLGMLIAGIVLRNLPLPFLSSLNVPQEWSAALRRIAFVVILLRGGLSLDGVALMKMKGACLSLALLPCSAEAIVVAAVSKLLFDLDILFGLLLGFVLAAVSPAVVVPAMIRIKEQGFGASSGVSSLVVAAASLDDVYAITLFSVALSILFSTGGPMWLTVVRAPLEVIGGCLQGAIVGYCLRYCRPSSRLFMLCAAALASFFGCQKLGLDTVAALSVLVTAFVAGMKWKEIGVEKELERSLRSLWLLLFQPLLFGLIGFELSFRLLTFRLVGLGLLTLLVCVSARTAVAFLATCGSGLSRRERLFVAIAWIPKATVQAALAPVALDLYMQNEGRLPAYYKESSVVVFTLSVLSILTTAPIGAAAIRMTAPLLLEKTEEKQKNEGEELCPLSSSENEGAADEEQLSSIGFDS